MGQLITFTTKVFAIALKTKKIEEIRNISSKKLNGINIRITDGMQDVVKKKLNSLEKFLDEDTKVSVKVTQQRYVEVHLLHFQNKYELFQIDLFLFLPLKYVAF